ncbi:hypothetical protein A6770_17970 [Nostoc minutum NIES-26]|uniref:Uncharacterized protein n=1 Tax=Nostoc minutum NIES-26 TaxID=1844469 RepID=A0A367RAV6_9NOSO|nr:hypothetical protein [Dendronalium sp. ChiSLP03b]MDZ8204010.1 hypothetical protein [Dendronalium sp. ChiSLP03b]RCJ33545.1 hypothetical protein A6770_17970 [Nostoc minutum NIES-26]
MKHNYFMQRLSTIGRWMATTLFCLLAIAFVWQGAFFSNTSAMANPSANSVLLADAGNEVKSKASEDAGRAKGFIEDTKDKVKRTANKNAAKVDEATDNGSFAERKAKRDAARIQQRADEDASRTKEAVDNTKNVVEKAVDNIKDAFSK